MIVLAKVWEHDGKKEKRQRCGLALLIITMLSVYAKVHKKDKTTICI